MVRPRVGWDVPVPLLAVAAGLGRHRGAHGGTRRERPAGLVDDLVDLGSGAAPSLRRRHGCGLRGALAGPSPVAVGRLRADDDGRHGRRGDRQRAKAGAPGRIGDQRVGEENDATRDPTRRDRGRRTARRARCRRGGAPVRGSGRRTPPPRRPRCSAGRQGRGTSRSEPASCWPPHAPILVPPGSGPPRGRGATRSMSSPRSRSGLGFPACRGRRSSRHPVQRPPSARWLSPPRTSRNPEARRPPALSSVGMPALAVTASASSPRSRCRRERPRRSAQNLGGDLQLRPQVRIGRAGRVRPHGVGDPVELPLRRPRYPGGDVGRRGCLLSLGGSGGPHRRRARFCRSSGSACVASGGVVSDVSVGYPGLTGLSGAARVRCPAGRRSPGAVVRRCGRTRPP